MALDLRRPVYRPTAPYRRSGREDLDLPWERTDKVNVLTKEAGLKTCQPHNQVRSPFVTSPGLSTTSFCAVKLGLYSLSFKVIVN